MCWLSNNFEVFYSLLIAEFGYLKINIPAEKIIPPLIKPLPMEQN